GSVRGHAWTAARFCGRSSSPTAPRWERAVNCSTAPASGPVCGSRRAGCGSPATCDPCGSCGEWPPPCTGGARLRVDGGGNQLREILGARWERRDRPPANVLGLAAADRLGARLRTDDETNVEVSSGFAERTGDRMDIQVYRVRPDREISDPGLLACLTQCGTGQ